jgi:hypothetical protein
MWEETYSVGWVNEGIIDSNNVDIIVLNAVMKVSR